MRSVIGLVVSLIFVPFAAISADLAVQVNGIKSDKGRIGCSLHLSGDTFPMGEAALQQWQPAQKGTVSCVFSNVSPGMYAIAVSHDLNENGMTDTNFLGIPKEDWGVSNNVRPTMRAPTFDEAKFQFPNANSIEISID
ncbi:DUF2141 domain-containing protein [Rheinheimera baltica]|uniref:DUF2141 domain-containing protein n=1 Tax=Rheinheimera baltica TaxID=67576 RepID=UPI00041C2865|nr:DUF2141 domain-containing protein [Rheinheimera baltica]